ncbi:tpr repeat containing protein [Anaeramoeba flamelloides]|uniref:Tpr repeat containing protein n=1 Tax=Anaeramoeba flamelloides TaxID=1746091 RepID=A0ABQ8Y4C5_9EUKA|nr:tpr repeat containing protein [Anaeramoeba flamelloides]
MTDYKYYRPSDYEYSLFSFLSYLKCPEQDEKYWPTLAKKGWVIYTRHSYNGPNGILCLAFLNEQTRQVVISIRGSVSTGNKEMLQVLKEIVRNQITKGIKEVESFVLQVLEKLKNEKIINVSQSLNDYQLSFTGHSLGAWISEVTSYNFKQIHFPIAVTFDSPGCFSMLKSLSTSYDPFSKVKQKPKKKEKTKRNRENCEELAIQYKKEGNQFYIKKLFAEALKKYDKGLKYCPSNILIHNNKAAVLIELGEYEQAIDICEMCLELSKTQRISDIVQSKVLLRLANAYKRQGGLRSACLYYSRSLEKSKSKKIENLYERTKKQLEQELEKFGKVKCNSEQAKNFYKQAQILLQKSQYQKAIQCLSNAMKILNFNNQTKYYLQRARIYLKINQLQKSLADYNYIILKLDPEKIIAYYEKSKILLNQKRFKSARAVLKRVIQLNPNYKNAKILIKKVVNKIKYEKKYLKKNRIQSRIFNFNLFFRTYLSYPNITNTLNEHVGEIRKIYPKFEDIKNNENENKKENENENNNKNKRKITTKTKMKTLFTLF